MSTFTRYQAVEERLEKVCAQAGRNRDDILLLAVSKTVDVDQVELAAQAGARAFGENRPDELVRKQAAFPQYQWHFIGNIQSRRIPDIVSAATLIHSVCKVEHLVKIDKAAAALDKVQSILIEVNVSGEESKSGFTPAEVMGVLKQAVGFEHLSIKGLMTMAPRADEESIQETFSGLAQLKADLSVELQQNKIPVELSELSMGMTEDWPQAVALGTTIIRVGRAIFSDEFDV